MKVVRTSSFVAAVVVAVGLAGALPAQAAAPTPPVAVTTQPADQAVNAGADASFSAAAQDAAPADVPVSTWQSQPPGGAWSDVSGSAGDGTLTVGSVTADQDGTSYRALFDDGLGGTIATDVAVLTVHFGPQVTTQPHDQAVARNSAFSLTAAATGNPTPTVQWQTADSSSGPWSAVRARDGLHLRWDQPRCRERHGLVPRTVQQLGRHSRDQRRVGHNRDDPPSAVDYAHATNPERVSCTGPGRLRTPAVP